MYPNLECVSHLCAHAVKKPFKSLQRTKLNNQQGSIKGGKTTVNNSKLQAVLVMDSKHSVRKPATNKQLIKAISVPLKIKMS